MSAAVSPTSDENRHHRLLVFIDLDSIERREIISQILKLRGYPDLDQRTEDLDALKEQADVIRTLKEQFNLAFEDLPRMPTLYSAMKDWDVVAKEGERLLKKTEHVRQALQQTTYSTAWKFPPGHGAPSADNAPPASSTPGITFEHEANMLHGVYRPTSARVKAILETMSLYEKKLDVITSFHRDVRLHFDDFKHKAAIISVDLALSEINSRHLDDKITRANRALTKPGDKSHETTFASQSQVDAGAGNSRDVPPPPLTEQLLQASVGVGRSRDVPPTPRRPQRRTGAGIRRSQSVPPPPHVHQFQSSADVGGSRAVPPAPPAPSREIARVGEGSEDDEGSDTVRPTKARITEPKGKEKACENEPQNSPKHKVTKSRKKGKKGKKR